MSCTAAGAWEYDMPDLTWEVLIPTIPHRHGQLCELLAEFDRQWQPGFGVRVLRDNLERPGIQSHAKRGDLVKSSSAGYVCDVDDDDWVAPDYVASIMEALQSRPDYVGFKVNWTRNGQPYGLARHSLEYDGYGLTDPLLWTRDITHLNPLRRDLALLADWTGHIDEEWAAQLRATGQVKTQVMIDRVLYHYLASTGNAFDTHREPFPLPLPALPDYPWLTVL